MFRKPRSRFASEWRFFETYFRSGCLRAKAGGHAMRHNWIGKVLHGRGMLTSHGVVSARLSYLEQRQFGAEFLKDNCTLPVEGWMMRTDVMARMKSVQTKLVAGLPLSKQLTALDLALAKRRLASDFAWVGITERWRESIYLFHATFRMVEVVDAELSVSHPTKPVSLKPGGDHLANTFLIPAHVDEDPMDEKLYEAALMRFELDLTIYCVPPSHFPPASQLSR